MKFLVKHFAGCTVLNAHILVWLVGKIMPDQIGSIILAKISDITTDPKLFELKTWALWDTQQPIIVYERRKVSRRVFKKLAC